MPVFFSKDVNGVSTLYNVYCLHVAKKASVGRGDSFYVLICCLEVSFNRNLLDFEVMFNLPRILRCDRKGPRSAQERLLWRQVRPRWLSYERLGAVLGPSSGHLEAILGRLALL